MIDIVLSIVFVVPFAIPEFGSGEESQTKVDGSRSQGIGRLIQFDAERIGGVEFSCFYNEDLREVGINPPIPGLIGKGKGILRGTWLGQQCY